LQTTSTVLMIRPARFEFNSQTAVNNSFQVKDNSSHVQESALQEFEGLAAALQKAGVEVMVVSDTPEPHTPDSIFPNNWISFHAGHTICLYPMFAPNRRLERKPGLIRALKEKTGIKNIVDLTRYEKENRFLEGTGSMVLDRQHRIAYACLSPRTDRLVLDEWCAAMEYTSVVFHALDSTGNAIYHTNVMMCIADRYAVICLECILDIERPYVIEKLQQTGKEIISISREQVTNFAGNMLQVQNADGEKLLVMSSRAFDALTGEQVKKMEHYNTIIHSPVPVIETNGGGSVRCMIAEVF